MKTNTWIMIISFFTVLHIPSARAEVDLSRYDVEVDEIQRPEGMSNWTQAIMRAATLANKIADEAKFDQLIQEIDNSINEIHQETRVGTFESFSAVVSALGSAASYSIRDITGFLITNEQEVNGFDRKVKQDYKNLQGTLSSYLEKNTDAMFYAKYLTAKAVQLTKNLSIQDLKKVYPFLTKTVQRVSQVHVLGMQHVVRCVTTNYLGGVEGKASQSSAALVASASFSRTIKEAYSEQSCRVTHEKNIDVSENAKSSFPLLHADLLLKQHVQLMSLRMITESKAPEFATWGSPHFNQKK